MTKSIIICILTLLSCQIAASERTDELYQQNILPVLSEDLWSARDAYDAAHKLILPMHFAFKTNKMTYCREFSNFFSRFANRRKNSDFEQLGQLNQDCFYFFAAFFLAEAALSKKEELVPANLVRELEEYVISRWENHQRPWHRVKIPLTVHLHRILNPDAKVYPEHKIQHGYYKRVTDLEWFVLATTACLKIYHKNTGKVPAGNLKTIFTEFDTLSLRIFRELIAWDKENKYWSFQPGVWKGHPDYKYAGLVLPPPQQIPCQNLVQR